MRFMSQLAMELNGSPEKEDVFFCGGIWCAWSWLLTGSARNMLTIKSCGISFKAYFPKTLQNSDIAQNFHGFTKQYSAFGRHMRNWIASDISWNYSYIYGPLPCNNTYWLLDVFFFHPINSDQVRKHCRDRLVAADSSLSRTLVRFAVAAVALGTITIYY